uniref:Uncharacterized protein n=1 Tax=mine drainage metagenome TaxID=410659 RepID=E6PZP4_9ZZZZ
MCGQAKEAGERGGHKGVHQDQAGGKGGQPEDALAGAAESGGKEEEHELAGGLRADAVEHTDKEDGAFAVVPGEKRGSLAVGLEKGKQLPVESAKEVDGGCDAALHVVGVGVGMEEASDDGDAKHDEGGSDESLGEPIKPCGQGNVKLYNQDAESDDGERVAEGVEQTKAHGAHAAAGHGGDVGDGGEMVVVEAMTQAEDKTG